MSKSKSAILTEMYRAMPPEALQEEIDAIFEIIFAMLESQDCDSMECYPNPSIKVKFSCEVMKDHDRYIC